MIIKAKIYWALKAIRHCAKHVVSFNSVVFVVSIRSVLLQSPQISCWQLVFWFVSHLILQDFYRVFFCPSLPELDLGYLHGASVSSQLCFCVLLAWLGPSTRLGLSVRPLWYSPTCRPLGLPSSLNTAYFLSLRLVQLLGQDLLLRLDLLHAACSGREPGPVAWIWPSFAARWSVCPWAQSRFHASWTVLVTQFSSPHSNPPWRKLDGSHALVSVQPEVLL